MFVYTRSTVIPLLHFATSCTRLGMSDIFYLYIVTPALFLSFLIFLLVYVCMNLQIIYIRI